MLERIKLRSLDDFFVSLDKRQSKGIFFYRINGYSNDVEKFIQKYYEVARKTGVVIEGKIPNPDEKNLSYFGEMMGMDFVFSPGFIADSLKKWLPRMNDFQRNNVSISIYDSLDSLRKAGKTENMVKNAYIKFMCWLYYRFERVVNQLGENNVPKILYEGDISNYELMMISILGMAGCDVVILQYHGDENYLKIDAGSHLSDEYKADGLSSYPSDFSIKRIRELIQEEQNSERMYGTKPTLVNCTNAWISGKGLEDLRESIAARGNDPKLFYNCFYRINGAEDKLTYANELFRFQQELKSYKRRVVIVNEEIPKPTPDEIASIRRNNYAKQEQMIMDLSANIQYPANNELQRLMVKSFVDVLLEESKTVGGNLNKLTNKAVYLLCWLKRYTPLLFNNWKTPEIACFIYFGGCKNDNEAMLLKFFARLPIDVLILCPNLNVKCCLEDKLLYEISYEESLAISRYPESNGGIRIGTAAYHAERDLDTIMYQNSGIYRNQQYSKANVISLQTMYEEIRILWDQELKYRPNFSTSDGVVNIPVFFSKISGIKDGNQSQYWMAIRELVTDDTILVARPPYIEHNSPNPLRNYVTDFYKNGKIQKNKIKNHQHYKYGILREDMQDFMLDMLQQIIDQKLIKGIGENGTEYVVVSTILNLPKDILRLIQKFDFTKKNPKLIYVNTTEEMVSLEDAIMTAFLNLIGFDIIFFVPTGYQNVERYFTKPIMEEHQIGEYVYDLRVPDIRHIPLSTGQSWLDKLFKRGN